MIVFINYLKFAATVLITNSHFGDIWPISALASGGLLGNIIFFAVSGYLLFNIKDGFPKWFSKRFFRVYPAMAAFTLIAVAMGEYSLNSFSDAFKLFIYPTNYVFLVWLVVCYCVYYGIMYMYIHFVNKNGKNSSFIEITMLIILAAWITVYVLFCDKSVYSVDNVSEPFILFLYIESMLLGAFFRKNKERFERFSFSRLTLAVLSFAVYIVSKILVSKVQVLLSVQLLNQFVIFITLFFTFSLFISLENVLKKIPDGVNNCVRYISNITLQIYIVQFVIIEHFEELMFPLNFVVVVLLILAAASALYYVEILIRKMVGFSVKRFKEVTN